MLERSVAGMSVCDNAGWNRQNEMNELSVEVDVL